MNDTRKHGNIFNVVAASQDGQMHTLYSNRNCILRPSI